LRTILCCVRSAEQAEAVAGLLQSWGFSAGPATDEGDHGLTVALTRAAPPPARGLLDRGSRLWDGLSRIRQR
jgi:hypothetical protein